MVCRDPYYSHSIHGPSAFYAEGLFERPANHAGSAQHIALRYGAAKTPPIHTRRLRGPHMRQGYRSRSVLAPNHT